jgi:hypothetical protein
VVDTHISSKQIGHSWDILGTYFSANYGVNFFKSELKQDLGSSCFIGEASKAFWFACFGSLVLVRLFLVRFLLAKPVKRKA